jgi:hypothetical protein
MTGIIASMRINLLIIGDLPINSITLLRNVKTMIKSQELGAKKIVLFPIPTSNGCIILSNIRLILANTLEARRKPVRKENYVHSLIMTLSKDKFKNATSSSSSRDLHHLPSSPIHLRLGSLRRI